MVDFSLVVVSAYAWLAYCSFSEHVAYSADSAPCGVL
jgi:hypothetical protein